MQKKKKDVQWGKSGTTGNPLSKRPKPTSATTGTIPNGLKNLKEKIILLSKFNTT